MITLLWMYPRHLNTYGDGGNLQAFRMRCRWRGLDAVVRTIDPSDRVPARADFVFIGGGQDRSQAMAAPAVARHRAGLAALVAGGAVVLGVCAGYQFLGDRIDLADGTRLAGLGLLDVVTTVGSERRIGKVVVEPHPALGLHESLVGFENHAGRTAPGSDAHPLGDIVGRDDTDGAFHGNVFGTYLHGPVLPTNPALCDLLIRRVLRARGASDVLEPLPDRVERAAAAAYRS